jgi:hypothetical protein
MSILTTLMRLRANLQTLRNTVRICRAEPRLNSFSVVARVAYICTNASKWLSFPIAIILLAYLKWARYEKNLVQRLHKLKLLSLLSRHISIENFLTIRKCFIQPRIEGEIRPETAQNFNIPPSFGDLTQSYVKLPLKVPQNSVSEIIRKLFPVNGFLSHVSTQGSPGSFSTAVQECPFFSYDIAEPAVEECVTTLLQTIPFAELLRICCKSNEAYIYSVNIYWAFPRDVTDHYVKTYHRDYDGFNSYALFIALTDTQPDDGATIFFDEIEQKEKYLSANAGEIYLMDPFAKHRANSLFKKPRLLCWVRFGEWPNLGFYQDLGFRTATQDAMARLNYNLLSRKFPPRQL